MATRKIMRRFIFLFVSVPVLAAGPPIGYVQITTNPITAQSGSFNVQGGSATVNLAIPYVSGIQCLHTTTTGGIVGTGADCGVGSVPANGGVIVNVASQYATPYYSVVGSSSTLSGVSAGTAGQILSTQGGAGPPHWINNTAGTSIQNQSTLQSGATAYPSFVYVGTSETVFGPFQAVSSSFTYGMTAGSMTAVTSITDLGLNANQCIQTNGSGQLISTGQGCIANSSMTVLLSSGIAFGSATNTVTQDTTSFSWNDTTNVLNINGTVPLLSTSTLQSGATFYVSSGTVKTQFNIIDSNANFQFVPRTGSGVAGTLLFMGNSTFANADFNLDYWPLTTGLFSRILFTHGDVLNTFQQKGWNFEDGGGNVMASISTKGNGDFTSLVDTGTLSVSSNTILPGATFYQGGGGEVLSSPVTVGVSSTNSCGYLIGSLVGYSSFTVTASSAPTGTFSKTNLFTTIAPKCATDLIRVSAVGSIYSGANAVICDALLTLNGVNLNAAGDLCTQYGNTLSGDDMNCTMIQTNLPATTSSSLYAVWIRSSSSGNCVWNQSGNTTILLLEDIAQ